jgi:hypothetical protein
MAKLFVQIQEEFSRSLNQSQLDCYGVVMEIETRVENKVD